MLRPRISTSSFLILFRVLPCVSVAKFLPGVLLGLVLAGVSAACSAQSAWSPQRNVEIVVASAPGGSNDRTARQVERILTENKLVSVTLTVANSVLLDAELTWRDDVKSELTLASGQPLVLALREKSEKLRERVEQFGRIGPAPITHVSFVPPRSFPCYAL